MSCSREYGLRTSKTVNGVTTTHIWDGQNIALDINGGNVTKYLRGINLIASDLNGTRNYYLYNGHSDVVQLRDGVGNTVRNYDYDVFENQKGTIDPADSNPFRYCSEYWDAQTSTYYLRARYYSPSTGRFITEDSFTGRDNDPLSLNLYTYCGNNPVNLFDPTGARSTHCKHLTRVKA